MATAQERARARLDALIVKVAEGDRQAFSKLYDQTSAKLFGLILRLLMDRDAAEDVLQEVYGRVWLGAAQYRPGGAPLGWLIGVARTAALERLRARSAEDIPLDPVPELEDASEQIATAGQGTPMVTALATLPPGEAAFLRAAYLDGDGYSTLALRHGTDLAGMRRAVRRCLSRLRVELGR